MKRRRGDQFGLLGVAVQLLEEENESGHPQLRLHKKSDTLALLMTIRKQTFVLVYEGGHP